MNKMDKMEGGKGVYRFSPTEKGLKYYSKYAADPERKTCVSLFPDCDRTAVFDSEEMKIMENVPFRPVVLAQLSPRYRVYLRNVSGYAG